MEYLTSDLHLGETKLRSRVRTQFTTDREMAEHIRDNWNAKVHKNDIVYVIGDIGRREFIEEFFPQLNGTKVLIAGNHDNYSKSFYSQYFDYVYKKPFFLTDRILLSHIPQPVEDGKINIHGHTHEIYLDLPNYYNVGVELNDYTPVPMKKFYDALGRMRKPTYKFMYEWYAKHQKTDIKRYDIVVKDDGMIDVDASRIKLAAIKQAKK